MGLQRPRRLWRHVWALPDGLWNTVSRRTFETFTNPVDFLYFYLFSLMRETKKMGYRKDRTACRRPGKGRAVI